MMRKKRKNKSRPKKQAKKAIRKKVAKREEAVEEKEKGMEEVVAGVAAKAREREEKVIRTEQLVTFELDKEEYASVITDLREIVRVPDIVPIPGAPEFIKGIFNLRGQIVVVIDLEKRFRLKREHPTEPRHIIIAEVGDNVFGVVVDEVTGVLRAPVTAIKPVPSLITSKIKAEYLTGVVVMEEAEEETRKQKNKKTKKQKEERSQISNVKSQMSSRLLLLLDLPKMLSEKELLEFGNHIRKTVEKLD